MLPGPLQISLNGKVFGQRLMRFLMQRLRQYGSIPPGKSAFFFSSVKEQLSHFEPYVRIGRVLLDLFIQFIDLVPPLEVLRLEIQIMLNLVTLVERAVGAYEQ